MFTIISYDIVEDKRRTKVMNLLKGYGTRVQYSVFECELTTQEFATIGKELRTIIDANTDSVRCYRLDADAVQRIAILGIGRVTTDPGYYLI
ncbi:CRISPR-associated endonuclease Cas2 [Candidatus Chloroploca sp. M-50]|uniref:CRISPR-associated endoribonuclease Cas2 n=1 Tax=Candidatus Chloroploca mongolica TaxID=2528176 RepID=A0ABS4DGA9_9CHLR|nr:CRISPR-associated endonuclease Cas2 [Candidatus Chloroploca mongolica]MBP1468466.1 CRISPR-associated endonuclease Cas2 [Candidatus Chloroploca mongolica]NCC31296.1 CRISPR-associated endonuclease Cas2 [Chloroflexia bacterium]